MSYLRLFVCLLVVTQVSARVLSGLEVLPMQIKMISNQDTYHWQGSLIALQFSFPWQGQITCNDSIISFPELNNDQLASSPWLSRLFVSSSRTKLYALASFQLPNFPCHLHSHILDEDNRVFVPSLQSHAAKGPMSITQTIQQMKRLAQQSTGIAMRLALQGVLSRKNHTMIHSPIDSPVSFIQTGSHQRSTPSQSWDTLSERSAWYARLQHAKRVWRMNHFHTLATEQEMKQSKQLKRITRPGDVGASSGVQSCAQLMTMETHHISSEVAHRIKERLSASTEFPSFIVKPLMVGLLAPISENIEKRLGPKVAPVLTIVFTDLLAIPTAIHLVGYLVHKMSMMLANILIESLTYKTVDYVVSTCESSLARDISEITMTALAKWFQLTALPEASQQMVQLIPPVLTPGLSAALTSSVVQAITPPLTHALKRPVLGYYYCQYCYSYGEFCQFCHYNKDVRALEQAWWLDI